ncbi:DUF4328 domain-containing protein [Solirubrobacter pauli]|nr:DUF4328 domain-containing protein [Solirubrobacter pauli]
MRRAFLPLRSRMLEVTVALGVFLACSLVTVVLAVGAPYLELPVWLWVLSFVAIVVNLLVGGFFISWLKRAYWNASSVDQGSDRFDHSWAVTSWFVPVLNLYRPLQMVHDVWRAARLGNEALPAVWWVSFQAWGWVSFSFWWLGHDWYVGLLGLVLGIVAAIFAIVIVVEATRGLQRRNAELEADEQEPTGRFDRSAFGQLAALRAGS